MSRIQKVFTLDQAKKITVIPGEFVLIEGYTPVTQGWKNSEGSALPEEIKAYTKKDRPVVIIKITKNKTKVYAFPLGKALCSEKSYYQVLEILR